MEILVGVLIYYIYYYQLLVGEKLAENLMYMVSYCDYLEGSLYVDSMELFVEFFEMIWEFGVFFINGDLIYYFECNFGDVNG